MRNCDDPLLRRFLIFMRFTGCRPGEAARAKWVDIDWDRNIIVLAEHKTKKKTGKPRVLYLHPVCINLLRWLQRDPSPSGLIFVNAWGQSWKNAARSQRLQRIRERSSLPADAKYYGMRHAFGTRAILNGVEIKTVSTLMGHSSTKTTEIYVHVADKHEHMNAAMVDVFGKKTAL
jgi:integrase